jgi:nitroreductase
MSFPEDGPPAGLHDLIRARWSPRQYLDRPIEPEKIRRLFEAACWAQSCFNEQPWRFIVATRNEPEGFAKILSLLAEKNQEWAKTAWLIGFSAGRKSFTQTGAANRFALHDTGAASENISLQAVAMGFHVHFMGGFNADRARTEFHVPDDFEVGAAFAAGYIDEASVHPPKRTRKGLEEVVFSGGWGQAASM